MNMAMNIQVPYDVGKFLTNCASGHFSRRACFHVVSYMLNILKHKLQNTMKLSHNNFNTE
jgi:hypothetical protein